MTDPEKTLAKAVVKSLLLSDHMGDVGDVISKLLRMIGEPAEDNWKYTPHSELMDEFPEILEWPDLWTLPGDTHD